MCPADRSPSRHPRPRRTSPALLAAILILTGASTRAAERPNILLILADDVGYSDIGCFGGEIRTPHLDALAAAGLRFTQFYNATRCCPSRASLLSGLYPHQAGVGDMTGDEGPRRPGYRGHLTARCTTLAEVLRSAGYRTSMVGKWHLGSNPGPIRRGFGDFYGMIGGFNSFWQEEPFYTRLPSGRPKRTYPPGRFYSTDAFADTPSTSSTTPDAIRIIPGSSTWPSTPPTSRSMPRRTRSTATPHSTRRAGTRSVRSGSTG